MFEDQSEIFEKVKKLFPMVDWKTVELNGDEIHKRDGLGTDNPLLALSRAVDFTKAVILAVADITLEIAESEPPEEVKLLLDQIRAKAAGQPVTRPTIDRFRGVPRTQDGQIIN